MTHPSPIRVLIVDDHPVVRHGLRSLLSGNADIEVVGEAASGSEILPSLAGREADVLLLDVQMKGQNGIDAARRVRHSYPAVKIIVLTTYDDEGYLRQAVEAGVHGYLLKSASHESLPESIRAVMRGEKLLSPSLVSTAFADYQRLAQERARQDAGLADEELKVLAAIASGASNKELAEKFFWSEATAKRRVQEILAKIGASSRAQAIAEAVRRGWIE
ncbi:MAG: response regulator transcription factor [Chloroflexi bacterium]|nr:response regulator transcription factor [Chloroflexota bacterium]